MSYDFFLCCVQLIRMMSNIANKQRFISEAAIAMPFPQALLLFKLFPYIIMLDLSKYTMYRIFYNRIVSILSVGQLPQSDN